MKKNLLTPLFFLLLATANAQLLKKPSIATNFSDSLSKIVIDFKNNFAKLQASPLSPLPDAEVYRSRICLPGGKQCVIYRYHSNEDHSANWQSLMYAGESFDEAIKPYTKTFTEVKKTKVNVNGKPSPFNGDMEKTDENVRFAVSSLRLKTDDATYKNLVAEVELTNNYGGWEVHLNIYSKPLPKKEAEDEE